MAGGVVVAIALLALAVERWLFFALPQPLLPEMNLPSGIGSLRAADCGACHATIYAEWASSRMAAAYTDPDFQADWTAQGSLYACLYCHAPLVEQRPERIVGLVSLTPIRGGGVTNPSFDATLRDEGVTCVTCHLREGALVGPFADTHAPHATRADPTLATDATCADCHQAAEPPLSDLRRPLIDTMAETAAWRSATGRTEDCLDCHMPPVERPLVEGGPTRPGRAHTWRGGWDEDTVRGALDLTVLADGSLQVVNRAGHGFPTADPARALVVTGWLRSADGGPLRTETHRIERSVRLPRFVDLVDTTLLPDETRVLRFDTTGATSIRVQVVYDRLAGLPHARAATADAGALVLLDTTRTL
jgi:nitrate/TMAO reductase-like tetraheme cytochrome c subunit